MVKKRTLAFVLILSLLFGAIFAWALVPGKTAEALGEEKSKLLYYFKESTERNLESDEKELAKLCQIFQENGIIDGYYVEARTADQILLGLYSEDLFTDLLQNPGKYAYLIVDLDEMMKTEFGKDGFSVFLDDLFSMLKTEDSAEKCKIMFISATDENFFKGHNAFLDKTDIHVNTDVYEIFMQNVFYQIDTACGGSHEFNDLTLIVDDYTALSFIPNRFLSALREQSSAQSVIEYLNAHNIKIVVFHNDGIFYDYVSTYSIPEEELADDYLCVPNLFAIGANWYDDDVYDAEWQDTIYDLGEKHGLEILFFQYENDPHKQPEIPTYIGHGPYDITFLIEAFVSDADLEQYINWPGRCIVTHKTMTFGEGGWMYSFQEGDEFFDFFDKMWYKEL